MTNPVNDRDAVAAVADYDVNFDASEDRSTNPTGNKPFVDVALKAAASRRTMLQGSLAVAAATGFLAPEAKAGRRNRNIPNGALVDFTPLTIEEATADNTVPSISPSYQMQVLIPWGTPITPGATTEFTGDPNARPTAAEAELQVGIGHDGIAFFPDRNRDGSIDFFSGSSVRSSRGMLCVNHEFGREPAVLGKPVGGVESLEDVRIMQAVHGVSVVRIQRRRGEFQVVNSPNARRITVNTPVTFSGPAAGSPLLENPAGNEPRGTVNNCGSGFTPWGTYLTCEENFNGYFGSTNPGFSAEADLTEGQRRLGFNENGFFYNWHLFDERFDLTNAAYVNESNRFGWIVEIDPFDGTQTPVKRTALGRFKHEAIAIAVSGNGRIAAYMGDDQRFDYCYKYVSDMAWEDAIALGLSPLDDGKLFVARFNEDFTGDWLELTLDNPELAARFANEAEMLIDTRVAADILGATPMDRPEWTTIGQDGAVFWTLTNNTDRTEPNAANPEAPNRDGHIIRTVDSDDFLGNTFTWEFFFIASDTRDTEEVFSDPDAAYADPFGRLFIGTDGGQSAGLQDQLVVFDTTSDNPTPRRLMTGVNSDEITGWAFTDRVHQYPAPWERRSNPHKLPCGDGWRDNSTGRDGRHHPSEWRRYRFLTD